MTALERKINLIDLTVSGYWYCPQCQHISEPVEDHHGMNTCHLCGSTRIKWNPPIFERQISHPMAELFRQRLDAACNRCQDALRLCVQSPCEENFDFLSKSIAEAHKALNDLSQFEQELRNKNERQAGPKAA